MRRRWAAFLLALAVVGVPSWLAVQLAGAAAPAGYGPAPRPGLRRASGRRLWARGLDGKSSFLRTFLAYHALFWESVKKFRYGVVLDAYMW